MANNEVVNNKLTELNYEHVEEYPEYDKANPNWWERHNPDDLVEERYGEGGYHE